ncbi:MAG: hypothetical protein M3Q03_20645 [Chloroflexota bacterium]|nr:hypothetical protein [Chloroflexota bacterium]
MTRVHQPTNEGTTPARPADLAAGLRRALTEVDAYSRIVLPRYRLRPYQIGPARAIAESVEGGLGRQFAVVFSRQAGKDELLAQLLAFLLTRYQRRGRSAVLAAPTFRPQAALSRDRLVDRLGSPLTASQTRVRDGYAVHVGRASARFMSAAPGANARGQTADMLLVANEAQDIRPEVWDAVFDPMAASTNATTVFLGTVWSRETLLARQIRHLEELEGRDGIRRVWRVPWDRVARDLPAYGERVQARVEHLGADHPFVRTEYFLQELDGAGGLFPPHRLAQMQGDHPRRHRADPARLQEGKRYALLLDVAGEEEAGTGLEAFRDDTRRDSTALTVVEVEQAKGRGGEQGLSSTARPLASSTHPIYRVVDRMAWTGVWHTALHAQLVDLARNVWRASAVVVDATGVGAGLASFLAAALGSSPAIPVRPFVFTAASKSALGWDFLGLIDSGRFKEYADDSTDPGPAGQITRLYRAQLAATTYETLAGPGKLLRWSVPTGRGAGARHDDLVVSAALTAALEGFDWRPRTAIGHDPIGADARVWEDRDG